MADIPYGAAVRLNGELGKLLTTGQAAATNAKAAAGAASSARDTAVAANIDAQASREAAAASAEAAQSAAVAAGKVTSSVAAVPIAAFTVIKGDASCTPCDAAIPGDSSTILGLALSAGLVGAAVPYRRSGVVTDPSFAFTSGRPVFCGPGGALTQVVPSRPSCAFLMRVGVATSATSITLALQPPVILA